MKSDQATSQVDDTDDAPFQDAKLTTVLLLSLNPNCERMAGLLALKGGMAVRPEVPTSIDLLIGSQYDVVVVDTPCRGSELPIWARSRNGKIPMVVIADRFNDTWRVHCAPIEVIDKSVRAPTPDEIIKVIRKLVPEPGAVATAA